MPSRSYSQKTLKILFALSGNECAEPSCTESVAIPATEFSDAQIVGHICHIHALADSGPRSKAGLTSEELNDFSNLIILCPTHHAIVDSQHETYSADELRRWKEMQEEKAVRNLPEDIDTIQSVVFYPTELVDQHIRKEIHLLRKSRYFVEFDGVGKSFAFAEKLLERELRGGTDSLRSCALLWCARILSAREELNKAEELLTKARNLGGDTRIVDAFLCSQRGEKKTALEVLARIDSPISRSTSFTVVGHHEGSQEALEWLRKTGLRADDLDADGKFKLLKFQLELGRWEDAIETTESISEHDLKEVPVLHHMVALSHLLRTVPLEFRDVVRHQVPFEAATFPLASNTSAFESRRTAHFHFVSGAEAARELECHSVAAELDEYALWLALRDPECSDAGKKSLEENLSDLRSALRLVSLGLQFDVNLDPVAVEREIERHVAYHGDITPDAAGALFALAFTQRGPEAAANYIDQHYSMLSKHLNAKAIRFFQIQMLAQAGLLERANEDLKLLLNEGLSEAEESRLRTVIARAEGEDTVQRRMGMFEKTESLPDLLALVSELERREQWEAVCAYRELLFEKTSTVEDAEALASALNKSNRTDRIVTLLEENSGILAQSSNLQLFYCWALYCEGELIRARDELEKLSVDTEDTSFRALQINIGIALGDKKALTNFVTNEHGQIENRSAHELIEAAQLSFYLNLPFARELLYAAAEKGRNDAPILASAFFLATKAGLENDSEIRPWLNRAAELSGEDGPLWKVTPSDILDIKPEWFRHELETQQLLERGEIPMFFAAQSVNKSLVSFMLFPSLANMSVADARRRSAVPAYSGRRQSEMFESGGAIGIDATALLTLSFLDLLETTFDAFDIVQIPHSTLSWLMEEELRASFHQPSRIRDAHKIRDLLMTGVLERLSRSTTGDRDLSAQVGEDLAVLIAEAEKRSEEDVQRIVVRSSPVPKIASLLDEEADLTRHFAVLSSCQSVVQKLRQMGQITVSEERNALAFLRLHEQQWPHQPEIIDGATLYLDDLSVIYLLQIGVLRKLQIAGFRLVVSPSIVSEVDSLIAYESISGKVSSSIEYIRTAVNQRIESGKIRVGRRRNLDELQDQPISEHPTLGVFALIEDCDAIVVDDRFLNQHRHIDQKDVQSPLYTTLDLLDALVSAGQISANDRLEYRTNLRRAGFLFIPVRDDELVFHLNFATVTEGKLNETAELKAIRENILYVKMSGWLQLPNEAPWPELTEKAFVRALRTLWRVDTDITGVRARSNWILDQLDIENGDKVLESSRGSLILVLLVPPTDAPEEMRNAYRNWAEERILVPYKDLYPDLFNLIVTDYKSRISEFANQEQINGVKMTDIPNGKTLSANAVLNLAPSLIREALLDDGQFLEELGLEVASLITFGEYGVSFRRSELYAGIRQTLSGESSLTVADTDGQDWVLSDIDEGS